MNSLEGCTKRSGRNRGRSPRKVNANTAAWKAVPRYVCNSTS